MTKRRKRRVEVESAREAAIADARAIKAQFCLYNLMTVARSQADSITWIEEGGQELEDLYDALVAGTDHPLLRKWKRLRSANRPPPDARERHLRRFVYLLQVALTSAGLPKNAARELAVEALASDVPTITTQALEHWAREEGPLTDDDKQVINNVLERCGHEHKALAAYFVGLIQARINPFVRFHREH